MTASKILGDDLRKCDHPTQSANLMNPSPVLTVACLTLPANFSSKKGLEIVVIELSENHFEQLVEMYDHFEPKRAAQGLPPTGLDRIISWLDHLQKTGHNLVALYRKQLIGHAMLCPVNPTRAEFAIFIQQDFRNQGIGTKLTEVMLEFARGKGYRRIWLSVEVNNLAAIRVYKKLGFHTRDLFGPEQEMEICIAEC
jgi:RimJ/RimL family protein N-acetyltransferase